VSTAFFNYKLEYRPLRCGIAISNPNVNSLGCIGLIATKDGQDRWIVSCYHVLCRPDGGQFSDGEPIYQPCDSGAGSEVARLCTSKVDRTLDCAAALIAPGIESVAEILGLGRLGAAQAPSLGMRVLKSGCATGITEGFISDISGNKVTIEAPGNFPKKYKLTEPGDSGSVWIERSTNSPVALHIRGNDTGKEFARAVNILTVLHALGLTTCT